MSLLSTLVADLNEAFASVFALGFLCWEANDNRPRQSVLEAEHVKLFDAACSRVALLGFHCMDYGMTRVVFSHPSFPKLVFKVEYARFGTRHVDTNEKELYFYRSFPALRHLMARSYGLVGLVLIQERVFGESVSYDDGDRFIDDEQMFVFEFAKYGIEAFDINNTNYFMTATGPKLVDLGGFRENF